jgi:hypothetical protein
MCLALDLLWDDSVTIIPEFDLADAERLVKQLFALYKSGVHTIVRNTFRVTYCYDTKMKKEKCTF